MAQRLRSLHRGASLIRAEQSAVGALSTCMGKGLLTNRDDEAQPLSSGITWQQQVWASSIAVRYASTTTKGVNTAPDPGSLSTAPLSDTLADSATQPEFFPLPESSAIELTSAIYQATEALERASILGAKADAFFSASWCISGLQTVHESMGTPWWISILVFNVALRCITFPLMLQAQKGSAKMMMMNHDLLKAQKLQQAALKATSQEEHNRLMKAFHLEYKAVTAKNGDPMKTAMLVPGVMLLNGGIFLSIFTGISKLMAAKVPSLTSGGTGWFTDLTVSDPYYGLPIMCTLVTLAMVEFGMNMMDGGQMPERQQAAKGVKWFMRAMALAFIPAGGYVAAGTGLLWVSNTAFGVVQGVLLRNDGFRTRVGLPAMKALREMNAAVVAANAAAAPAAPANPAVLHQRADSDPAAANAAPLLAYRPKTSGVR